MIEAIETATHVGGFVVIGLAALLLFLQTPLSLVLNFVTIPLGYEWQTCPYCLDMGFEKVTFATCANCGEEHAENWGASWYTGGDDGEKYHFCTSDCLDEFKGEKA